MKVILRNTITGRLIYGLEERIKLMEEIWGDPSQVIMSNTICFVKWREKIGAREEQKGKINKKHKSELVGNWKKGWMKGYFLRSIHIVNTKTPEEPSYPFNYNKSCSGVQNISSIKENKREALL